MATGARAGVWQQQRLGGGGAAAAAPRGGDGRGRRRERGGGWGGGGGGRQAEQCWACVGGRRGGGGAGSTERVNRAHDPIPRPSHPLPTHRTHAPAPHPHDMLLSCSCPPTSSTHPPHAPLPHPHDMLRSCSCPPTSSTPRLTCTTRTTSRSPNPPCAPTRSTGWTGRCCCSCRARCCTTRRSLRSWPQSLDGKHSPPSSPPRLRRPTLGGVSHGVGVGGCVGMRGSGGGQGLKWEGAAGRAGGWVVIGRRAREQGLRAAGSAVPPGMLLLWAWRRRRPHPRAAPPHPRTRPPTPSRASAVQA